MLVALGAAVASRPFDLRRVHAAMERVKAVGGTELSIEAAAATGAFEAMTKAVDGTVRKPPNQDTMRVARVVMTMLKHRVAIHRAGAFVIAAIALSKLARW